MKLELSPQDQVALVEALEENSPPSQEVKDNWTSIAKRYNKLKQEGTVTKEVFNISDSFH